MPPVCLDVTDDDSPRKVALKAYIVGLHEVINKMQNDLRVSKKDAAKWKGVADQKEKELNAVRRLLQEVRPNLNCEEAVTIFKKNVSAETYELLQRIVGEDYGTYKPLIRTLALTIHYYSPAAYAYVRSKVNNKLPCESTIRRWYSSVGGGPGFHEEVFKTIEALCRPGEASDKPDSSDGSDVGTDCNRPEKSPASVPVVLLIDDMKIKKHVRMVKKQPVGLINYGGILDEKTGLEKQPIGEGDSVEAEAMDLDEEDGEEDDREQVSQSDQPVHPSQFDGELPATEVEGLLDGEGYDANAVFDEISELECVKSDDKAVPLATDACVLMIVFLTFRLKIPIGYFLHKGMKGSMLAILVKHAVQRLYEAGAMVVGLVSDGHNANFNMAMLLGAKLKVKVYKRKGEPNSIRDHVNWEEYSPAIPHPCDPTRTLFFLPDVCHMLKLVRNSLAIFENMIDMDGKRISWRFIQNLVKFQGAIGCRFGNRMSRVHIEWMRQKMKTKFAAQTLSNSVADALELLEDCLDVPEFRGARATARFCRVFNNLFDVLNSRSKFGKGLKAPMTLENEAQWSKVLRESVAYIKGLKDGDGVSVFNTRREKAFRGLLLAIDAIERIFDVLVRSGKMKYLLTYKLSQDALELLFGIIRAMGGFNDNPTAPQFDSAYTKTLFRNEVKASKNGNALPLENIQVLVTMSTQQKKKKSSTGGSESVAWDTVDWESVDVFRAALKMHMFKLANTVDSVTSFIAGFVAMKVFKACGCEPCSEVLIAHDQFVSGDVYNFVSLKSVHGVEYMAPTRDVLEVCRLTEVAIRRTQADGQSLMGVTKHRSMSILSVCKEACERRVFQCLEGHCLELDAFDNHILSLIKDIADCYWTAKTNYLTFEANDNAQAGSKRQSTRKETHFRNE